MPIISSNSFFVVNGNNVDLAKLDMALAYLQTSQISAQEIRDAVYNGQVSIIEISRTESTSFDRATNTIRWNPDEAMTVHGSSGYGVESPAMGLGHELCMPMTQPELVLKHVSLSLIHI